MKGEGTRLFSDTMNVNPIQPPDNQPPDDEAQAYLLPSKGKSLKPDNTDEQKAAADLIRRKLDHLYANEPDVEEEIAEVQIVKPQSEHQRYMQELASSGKSLAEIQTEWHHYYVTLPDDAKHQVWREFYESNEAVSTYHQQTKAVKPSTKVSAAHPTEHMPEVTEAKADKSPKLLAVHPPRQKKPTPKKLKDVRTAKEVKETILHHVSAGGQLNAKHHFQSLLFGLGLGFTILFIVLFTFFNEIIITPFIQPSRNASATPLILNTDSVAPTADPEVIIPKINVEIPADYSQTSTNEATIEDALESGVVHYPTTVMPGQNGNTAFFGHSSNNIFNKGKYKFAFVLLHTLVPGDVFYLTNNSKVYVYKVISKKVVPPTEVSVLGPVAGQTATATLITCDPPGTSLNRLIIVGQQISPNPSTNTAGTSSATTTNSSTTSNDKLPGNGPTLLGRIWRNIF